MSPTTSSSSPLPSILCLHGGGTNASIFKIQLIRLTRLLSPHFTFIFLTAPYLSTPGPEVLPTFEGCGPFMRWTKTRAGDELLPEVATLISRTIEENPGIVGVMGFSQGAKLAAGLLLEAQVSGRERRTEKETVRGESNLRFGVLLNGVSPPLISSATRERLLSEGGSAMAMELIRVPSVHVIGLQDMWRDGSRRLWEESFDGEKSVKLEFDVGHRLPILEADTQRIADEILRLHRETTA